jgi:hypothetical protein
MLLNALSFCGFHRHGDSLTTAETHGGRIFACIGASEVRKKGDLGRSTDRVVGRSQYSPWCLLPDLAPLCQFVLFMPESGRKYAMEPGAKSGSSATSERWPTSLLSRTGSRQVS